MAGKPKGARRVEDVVTWRPAAASFRNLLMLGAAAGVSSAVVMAFSRPMLTGAAVVLGLAAGIGVTLAVGARRLGQGLATAERPKLANWPGSEADRRRIERAGLMRGVNGAVVAAVLGATSGLVPAVGMAFAGAGTAAAATAWYMRREVTRYESERGVTVFAAHGAMQRRAVHRFGTA